MTTLTFRRPTVLPIHAWTWTRPAGNLDFRVTQRFDVADSYYGGTQKHNAVDLGNFRCGDAVVAMLAGRVRRVQDNATALGAVTNALGLVIDHGSGITSEYWHLQSYSVGVVDGVLVTAGQQVASVGRTGLGNVCHLHTEVKRNGIRIDPEPLMFGGSITVGVAGQEDDMRISGKFLRHVQNRQAQLTTGSNFRAGAVAGQDAALAQFPAGTVFYPIFVVGGRAVGTEPDATEWYGALMYISGDPGDSRQLGVFHSSVLPRTADGHGVALAPFEQTAGIPPDQAAQAGRLEFIRGRDEGTAAYAAAGAQAAQGVAP